MKIKKRCFGHLYNGRRVDLYTLKAGDLSLSVSTYGARWVSLTVPGNEGPSDVLLGYSTLAAYTEDTVYFGSTVGRYSNRISGGAFQLDGETFRLNANDGANTLHGGRRGFDRQIWKAEAYEEKDGVFLRLELKSPAGDMGFPGSLTAVVNYGLTRSNEVAADFQASPDAPCPVSLTNHSYFILAGEGEGDVLSHTARFDAPCYLETSGDHLPTGAVLPVKDGPLDFLNPKPIGRDIAGLPDGYDHCFVPSGEYGELRPAAEISELRSGRTLRVLTTQPAFHFYSGNQLKSVPGKPGSVYGKHSGFCVETQHFPDSPHHPNFPSAIFGPGRKYHERTLYSFDLLST
jgi:aldose 1-epimerase